MPRCGASAGEHRLGRRWYRSWHGLDLQPPADALPSLLAAYSSPQRCYHSGDHLHACLRRLDAVASLAREPCLIQLALWFHDAVYHPLGADNEELSAAWGRRIMGAAGAASGAVDTVAEMVLATRHQGGSLSRDQELICDIDLSILGAAPARFARYQQQIREEYRVVPADLYRRERSRVLRRFLSRNTIFYTDVFRRHYETRARANLHRALSRGVTEP